MNRKELDFTSNISPEQLEKLYMAWEGGEELPGDWRHFFAGYQLAMESPLPGSVRCDMEPEALMRHSAVQSLIYRYRDIGHLLACTDPLSSCPASNPYLELAAFGLAESDLDTVFATRRHYLERATLRQFLQSMRETYCREIGVEFMHIQDPDERQWLIDRMEPVQNRPNFSVEQRLRIFEMLEKAVLFEEFLHRRFVGQKRFSLEGGETLIAVLDYLLQSCPLAGITDLVMGMPHRGRLNVLAHIFGKPYEEIFGEFMDNLEPAFVGDGDVKYHKGFSADLDLSGGRLHLILASNPSHLEAVDPVVIGKARARQDKLGDGAKRMVLPVLLHGDAAFSGQGLVAEVFNMSRLAGYSVGGTIHIVVNNQIGFTTLPKDARSTRYSTDIAKMLACPVFHVHGETPEAAAHAIGLALEYRQSYGRDVVLELICYRKHGHNEGDEPAFTQPAMYRTISERLPVSQLYSAQLEKEGVSKELMERVSGRIGRQLEDAFSRRPERREVGYKEIWQGVQKLYQPYLEQTGVAAEKISRLARKVLVVPDGFNPHPKIGAMLKKRLDAVAEGSGIDWGGAECLAYATLLAEGVNIRISGQDVRRGTFNHRHAFIYDNQNGEGRCIFDSVAAESGAVFSIYDSLLSENGVLGFEYGYSLENPAGLTIWEAQFGDFANGAQVMIDQFISSGETKWNRASGLVMLLPHGYEGQGAEHSSARIERFLQLCAGNNMILAQPTTPAQMFHLLRRQMKQPFRKPLLVFTPKSLLRNPGCVSDLAQLSNGSFKDVVVHGQLDKARLLLLCSGRILYDLDKEIRSRGEQGVAIVSIEQLYPLDSAALEVIFSELPKGARKVWVQDEPENMGVWQYIRPVLDELLGVVEYAGRGADSCPAVGSHHLHEKQQTMIMESVFV